MKNISKKLSSIVLLTACLGGFSNSAIAVDGVILITQANAQAGNVTPGDTAGFPVTISRSGSYQLASNLTVPNENTDAIRFTADNVTLNLNGFAILGPNSCSIPDESVFCTLNGSGVGVRAPSSKGATIINGTIRGMGGSAIVGGDNLHVENLTINSNGGDGILQAASYSGAIVTRNTVNLNGGNGILAPFGGTITNNTVSFNGHDNNDAGIKVDFANLIGNTVQGNVGFGLYVMNNATTTGYVNNVFVANNGGGVQVSGGKQLGGNLCNGNLCP